MNLCVITMKLREDDVEWLPIETAPKDGTKILLYGLCWGEIEYGRDAPDIVVGEYNNGHFVLSEGECYIVYVKATHWMPLPPPPEGEK